MFNRRSLILALAAATALLPAACGSGGGSHSGHGDGSGSGKGFNDADVMFAQMMIPHHEQAVEMSSLAADRAADAEVSKIAEQIGEAQQPEIDTMKGWLRDWDEPTEAEGHGSMMEGMVSDADMKKLKDATGNDFDKLFTEHMIAHHEGAIAMAEDEKADGEFDDATKLAATIEKTQREEIERMEDMRATL